MTMPHGESPPSERPGDETVSALPKLRLGPGKTQKNAPRAIERLSSLGDEKTVSAFELPSLTPEQKRAQDQEDVRKIIARRLVFAYLVLLGLAIFVPIMLWIPGIHTAKFSIGDARDLMLATTGALSGLVGILGFVMGYYFKAAEVAAEMERQDAKERI